jgi:hypothetical protein
MARSELERLVSLGLISAWEASKVRRGSKDNSHIDTRNYLSGGRGDDADVGGHDGSIDLVNQINDREYQRPKPGFVADPKQQSANFPTNQDHIDRKKPAGGNWERPRKPDANGRWSDTLSVSRARKSSADEYWSNDWFGDQSGNKRQER